MPPIYDFEHTVTDDEIVTAMRFVFERMNVVVEPSGATALAAILAGRVDVAGQRVGVTLSGGNIGGCLWLGLGAGERRRRGSPSSEVGGFGRLPASRGRVLRYISSLPDSLWGFHCGH